MILSFSTPAAAEETTFERIVKTKTIRCGYFSWPPYITKDANTGKLSGINYDIMNAIGKNLGLSVEWTAEICGGDDKRFDGNQEYPSPAFGMTSTSRLN